MRDGWREARLGELLQLAGPALAAHREEPPVFSVTKYDGIVLASDYFDKRIASANLDAYRIVNPGDIVYSTIHIDEGAIARNNFSYMGVVSPMYTVLRPTEAALSEYLALALTTPQRLRTYFEHAAGTVNRRRSLPFSRFTAIKIVLPPLTQQRRIVDLIGAVDAIIIAAREVSSRARALQDSFRDSVAQHGHSIARLDDLLTAIDSGSSPVTLGRPPLPGERSVLKLSAVLPCHFDAAEVKAVSETTVLSSASAVSDGDLLMTRSNTPNKVGQACRARGVMQHTYLSDLVLRLHLKTALADPAYIEHALSAPHLRRQIENSASGTSSSMRKISRRTVRELRVPLPPLPEQRLLAALFQASQEVVDGLEVELVALRRVRSALISELVLGAHSIPASYDRFIEQCRE